MLVRRIKRIDTVGDEETRRQRYCPSRKVSGHEDILMDSSETGVVCKLSHFCLKLYLKKNFVQQIKAQNINFLK